MIERSSLYSFRGCSQLLSKPDRVSRMRSTDWEGKFLNRVYYFRSKVRMSPNVLKTEYFYKIFQINEETLIYILSKK